MQLLPVIKRSRRILLPLLAVLSLFVSAVSACACSHHQAEKVEEAVSSSCHRPTHESAKNESAESSQPKVHAIGVDCECFVRASVPVIASKSETKKTKASDSPCESSVAALVKLPGNTILLSELPDSLTAASLYTRPFQHSGPSRAPPRL